MLLNSSPAGLRWWVLRLAVVRLLALSGVVHADPLDRITGTEDWRAGRAERAEQSHWRDWLITRAEWRDARSVFQLEQIRNRRLARLLARPGPLATSEVRRVIRFRPRAQVAPGSPSPGRISSVPAERLNASGQAIDEEGDDVLQESGRRRPRER